jgi:hypothetical protein
MSKSVVYLAVFPVALAWSMYVRGALFVRICMSMVNRTFPTSNEMKEGGCADR